MTARVLVVDDNPTNAKLMEARLTAEYFEVLVALNGPDALKICNDGLCDIVLLDVIMPGMSGLEVCRALKSNRKTAHIPVVIVTRQDQRSDLVAGLEAGADDFLMEPTSTLTLTTRLRSLMRLKSLTDALMSRVPNAPDAGLSATVDISEISGNAGRVLIVDDHPDTVARAVSALEGEHKVDVEANAQEALFRIAEGDYDVAVIRLRLARADGLRLCSQLRSLDRTHLVPLLALVEPDDQSSLMRALDIGANDYLQLPIDDAELSARVRTQVRRKRFHDNLHMNVRTTLELALTDGLTGVRNRRYMERSLTSLMKASDPDAAPLALLLMDIDHFKSVNDTYGHPAGDAVLREFAKRISVSVRGIDIVARLGGEEFVVAMPETEPELAVMIGERLREKISSRPFVLPDGETKVDVTVSIGVSSMQDETDTVDQLIARADAALYRAKREGRNRVVEAAA